MEEKELSSPDLVPSVTSIDKLSAWPGSYSVEQRIDEAELSLSPTICLFLPLSAFLQFYSVPIEFENVSRGC